ncbi:hypothetical protein [Streptomyces beihaiensis]|uniref:Uncharacterized protein n=1 Tax=Streptomyces beihaiensis TaxID=2984495 RepID=A0ABT3TX59_9ACTN|nr:hypothetical protein [Streptomyces beihaiensis]MCX3061642.1 hypothetical protein [Streptomyces beihaiensis]
MPVESLKRSHGAAPLGPFLETRPQDRDRDLRVRRRRTGAAPIARAGDDGARLFDGPGFPEEFKHDPVLTTRVTAGY